MKHTFIIRSPEIKANANAFIQDIPLEPLHEIIIRPYKADRSALQNALMWKWYTVIGNEQGLSKEEVHIYYKGKFLVHIYERDDTEYAAMILAVRKVHQSGMKSEAKRLENAIIDLTSTTRANVSQMREYLTEIDRDAQAKGIVLPRRDDMYYEAMGIKR